MSGASQTSESAPVGGRDGIGQFLQDVWAELHRVQWPNQQTIQKHTTIVVTLVIFMAFYIGALDWMMTLLFNRLLH